MKRGLFAGVLALVAAATPVRAQVVGETPTVAFPDPKRFARGLFAEADVGAIVYLGKFGQYAEPGPALAIRLGYDLFRWFALQLHVGGSISGADTPPPTTGQDFEQLLYLAEGRVQLQLRRVGLYAEGGAGLAQITTNVLDAVEPATGGVTAGRRFSLTAVAGGGVDLHTLNRHFSVGLGADYYYFAQWHSAHALTVATYLRYTR